MESNSKKFNVSCPKCGMGKEISLPNTLFSSETFKTIKIKVPQGAVCENHNFIVFITTKGKIVGYDVIDASISLEESQTKSEDEIKLALEDIINIFGFNCVAGFIHAKLFDYPSFIVRNEEANVNFEDLNALFDTIIPLRFKNDNAIKDIEFDSYVFSNEYFFYNMVKEKEKNAFLINNRRLVIQVPWQTTIEFEKTILGNSLGKKDKNEQLKYLSHYINQFINDVQEVEAILENLKEISEKDLVKKLKEILITRTITKNRVALIKEFLERRVSPVVYSKIK
jgi:hypothetical protein